MLRRLLKLSTGFISGFYVLMLSSCAQAVSPHGVIAQLQTGASGGATQEYISMYNNASVATEVTGWCLIYSSSSDLTQTTLGCLVPPDAHTKLWLTSHSYITASTNEFKVAHGGFNPDIVFASGLADAGGHIKLVDASLAEIDRLGYGTATHPEGAAVTKAATDKILQRSGSLTLQDTDNNAADFVQAQLTSLPASGIFEEAIIPDVCANLEGVQETIPEGYESLDGVNCTLIPPPPENAQLLITELLPNAVSTDTGNEFIELFNPNDRPINLKNYKLELGPAFTKSFVFAEQTLAAHSYASFSDTVTGIVLPNTTASLRLTAPATNVVDTTASYDTPGDDMAWAVIGGGWQYTNQPTPGAANQASLEEELGVGGGAASNGEFEPCPAGKFRNPETNRCKNIEDVSTDLTPCAADQARNPETNRCRSILSTGSSLTPCQPGQERNPNTNRCRSTVIAASASLKPCPAGQERNPSTNRCRKKTSTVAGDNTVKDVEAMRANSQTGWLLAGGALATVGSYGVWEWRSELANTCRRVLKIFGKSPPVD